MNERQLIDYLMSEMRNICAITPDFDGEEDDDSAMASELSGCLGTAQRLAGRAIREGNKRIAGLPTPCPASEGEAFDDAVAMVRTVHVPSLNASGYLHKEDAEKVVRAALSSAGASGQDALPQSVLTALGNMKAQMPSEYAQVIRDKFWELTGPSDSIPARGVTVTEEMVERALTSGPIPNYCNFGHLLKRAGIANGQDWMRAALEAAIGGGVVITEEMRALAEHWERTAGDLYAASEKEKDPEAAKTQRIMKAVYRQVAANLRATLEAAIGGGGGWVSVKERMPEDRAVVIAYWSSADNGIGSARWWHGEWRDPDNDDHSYGPPKFWRPLPQPPSPTAAKEKQ